MAANSHIFCTCTKEILIQDIFQNTVVDQIFFASRDVALTSICHGYKLASLSWCCLLLPCSDGEKSRPPM